jgi:hypothetical protein
VFGGECVIRVSKRRPEKKGGIIHRFGGRGVENGVFRSFFRKKGIDIHKIGRQGVGKKGLQGMV